MPRKIFETFRPVILIALGILWCVGVGIGLYTLLDYEMTPGQEGEARRRYGQHRVVSHGIP